MEQGKLVCSQCGKDNFFPLTEIKPGHCKYCGGILDYLKFLLENGTLRMSPPKAKK